MEGAATLDVLVAIGAATNGRIADGKAMLLRIVAMLSEMTERLTQTVREESAAYSGTAAERTDCDYEHEHEKVGTRRVLEYGEFRE